MLLSTTRRNVEGARSAGLRAEQWRLADGVDALRERLGGHDLRLGDLRRLARQAGTDAARLPP